MDPFLGIVFLLAIGWAARSGLEHARKARTASGDRKVAAAEQASGAPLTPSARKTIRRQHDAGWWMSEVLHGAPVHRTGFHAGWLAHKAAADHSRHKREEARTTHLETRAAFRPALREHKARQAEALAAISGQVTDPAGGKEAAGQAAAKVLPFPRPQAASPAPGPYRVPPDPAWRGTSTDVKPGLHPAERKDMPATQAADTTYDQLQREFAQMIDWLEDAISQIRFQQLENSIEQIAAVVTDPQTLGNMADVADELREAKQKLTSALDSTTASRDELTRDHGGMNEAHQDAPVYGADPAFYEG